MNSSICLIVPSNLIYAPYYFRYEEILNRLHVSFDVIIWNREGLEEKTTGNLIEWKLSDVTNNGNWKKIYKFIGFSFFCKKIIKKNQYSYLVFLGSNAGNAILMSDFLKRKYKKRYWFDIRDYTYEWFKPFCFLEKRCIYNSYKTVISSKGYKKFLPPYPYLTAHNFDRKNISLAKNTKNIEDKVIRISFIGNMRYYDENIKFLNLFSNDDRFRMQYFGTGNELLRKYCIDHEIKNVLFTGRFEAEKTKDFYAVTDIINNLYGNDTLALKTALSNKLYYALELQKPVLVCPDTYMEEISVLAGVGFVIDYENTRIKELLIDWYQNFSVRPKKPVLSAMEAEDRYFESEFENYIMRAKK